MDKYFVWVATVLFIVQNSKAGKFEIVPAIHVDYTHIHGQQYEPLQSTQFGVPATQFHTQQQSALNHAQPETHKQESSIGRWAHDGDYVNNGPTMASTIKTTTIPAGAYALGTSRPNFVQPNSAGGPGCPPTVNCVRGRK